MYHLLRHKEKVRYWLRIFAWYAFAEACIQLIFLFILNNFGNKRISIPEFHLVMWAFQCLLIWPIWFVAWLVKKQHILIQVLVNIAFYIVYSYCWFGPVQDAVAYLYNNLQHVTRSADDRQTAILDDGKHYSYLNYQLLKHAFRLSWFYLGHYFYHYSREEKKRIELAVFNKELQLKLLKWHLNPAFYFKTIQHLQRTAQIRHSNATRPILQLAKVMEYVIYEAREPQIEMKKEIQFLTNYTQLLNQQQENKIMIELEYSGDYEKLKIAPLLLAGMVDNILLASNHKETHLCKIKMQFIENTLELLVNGNITKPAAPPLLEELYAGKYACDYSPVKGFNLRLQLNEAG